MLDNIAGLILAVGLLAGIFKFPVDFALGYMVPGTAIGVFVGDILFFWLALIYAKKHNRTDVTAMPLGLDTPSTIGMAIFVIGPAYLIGLESMNETDAATYAWHIGICSIIMTGVIKLLFSFGANWLRDAFPRAGLLGSLAAIALVLIAFSPLLEVSSMPVVGFVSLAIILTTLIAKVKLPFQLPGAAVAVAVGCIVYYAMSIIGDAADLQLVTKNEATIKPQWFPAGWMSVFTFEWVGQFRDSLNYLPYIIPFAITTVVGGIDCAESAASAGDDFNTGKVIGVEAIATIVAGFCGGVVQTTPYIGHPAYKAMGGRAAYTLATALFVGAAGVIGFFAYLYMYIPKAAILPILIFIGLEITAQSFRATPRRHYAAIAIACFFVVAKQVDIYVGRIIAQVGATAKDITDLSLKQEIDTISLLAGGFILTSLFWASALAKIIDRRFVAASTFFAVAGICTLFGFIHSPYQMHLDQGVGNVPGEKIFVPFDLPTESEEIKSFVLKPEFRQIVFTFAGAYLTVAVFCFLFGMFNHRNLKPIESDDEFEEH